MVLKTKYCNFEIEIILIIIIITSILSNVFLNFLYYFFACYLFILFHELMHIFIGSLFNKKLLKIKFSLSGVCASFKKEKSYEKNYKKNCIKYSIFNIIIYLAGPISNLILAYIFKSNHMIRNINIFLAILNFLPVSPLDGYNILLNLLNIFFKKKLVTKIINIINIVLILILLFLSIYQIKEYRNFSLCIFVIYILIIKFIEKNNN